MNLCDNFLTDEYNDNEH